MTSKTASYLTVRGGSLLWYNHQVPIERVIPIKYESASTGGDAADDSELLYTPAKPNEDATSVRGVYLQNDSSSDSVVLITRDALDNMTFSDVFVTKTLSELGSAGADFDSVLTSEFDGNPISASGNLLVK